MSIFTNIASFLTQLMLCVVFWNLGKKKNERNCFWGEKGKPGRSIRGGIFFLFLLNERPPNLSQ